MGSNSHQGDEAELKRLGIRRVEKDVFQRGDYIYSSLSDALAAAQRSERA